MNFKASGKNFIIMVICQIASIFGSAILRFAFSLYVLDVTDSAILFALILAISSIPGLVFSPVGGAIADRFDRRKLMILLDFISCAVTLVVVFLYYFNKNNDLPLIVIAVVMTVLLFVIAMYQPIVQASIPVLVGSENLAGANGIVSSVNALSQFAAPALGGVLYGFIGLGNIIIISAAAFFISAVVLMMFFRIPFKKPQSNRNIIPTIVDDIKEGAKYVSKEKPYLLRTIILATALNLFLMPLFLIGAPYLLRNIMLASDIEYGFGIAVAYLSTIAAALFIGFFVKRMSMRTLYKPFIVVAFLMIPMAIAPSNWFLKLGHYPPYFTFIIFAIPIVMIVTIVSIYATTYIQKETPNHLLGKVMAIVLAVGQCATPFGQIIYGWILDAFKNEEFIPLGIASAITFIMAFVAKILLKSNPERKIG